MGKRQRMTDFRVGDINAAGGPVRDERALIHRSVVATQFGSSATTAGDHGSFAINSWNHPLTLTGNTTFSLNSISPNRHPSGHVQILADGYKAFQVLKTHYRFDILHGGAEHVGGEIIFAYKFSGAATTSGEPIFTAGLATTEVWLDMQASSGWVWTRIGTTVGGNHRPSFAVVNVNIPNVTEMVRKIQLDSGNTLDDEDLKGAILDSVSSPGALAFLHFVAFIIKKDAAPAALAVNEIWINVRCTQTVRVTKQFPTADLIDEGDQV